MKFNPKLGDIIVTRNDERWVCMEKEDYESNFNVGSFPEVIFAKSLKYGIGSHMRWESFDGKCDIDPNYSIAEIIPAQKPEIKADAEISQDFKIKVLELENSILRSMLRKEGVDV